MLDSDGNHVGRVTSVSDRNSNDEIGVGKGVTFRAEPRMRRSAWQKKNLSRSVPFWSIDTCPLKAEDLKKLEKQENDCRGRNDFGNSGAHLDRVSAEEAIANENEKCQQCRIKETSVESEKADVVDERADCGCPRQASHRRK